VNLSSALSRFSLPNRSTYGVTKYGIQALSDCLRFEMKCWGISVSIIEPGSLVSGKEQHMSPYISKNHVIYFLILNFCFWEIPVWCLGIQVTEVD
jgi:short-subunit dehydrogenase